MTGNDAPAASVSPGAARWQVMGAAVVHCQPVPPTVTPVTPVGSELVKSSVTVNGPAARSGPLLLTVNVQVPVPPAMG